MLPVLCTRGKTWGTFKLTPDSSSTLIFGYTMAWKDPADSRCFFLSFVLWNTLSQWHLCSSDMNKRKAASSSVGGDELGSVRPARSLSPAQPSFSPIYDKGALVFGLEEPMKWRGCKSKKKKAELVFILSYETRCIGDDVTDEAVYLWTFPDISKAFWTSLSLSHSCFNSLPTVPRTEGVYPTLSSPSLFTPTLPVLCNFSNPNRWKNISHGHKLRKHWQGNNVEKEQKGVINNLGIGLRLYFIYIKIYLILALNQRVPTLELKSSPI